jgi:hypothetical protein
VGLDPVVDPALAQAVVLDPALDQLVLDLQDLAQPVLVRPALDQLVLALLALVQQEPVQLTKLLDLDLQDPAQLDLVPPVLAPLALVQPDQPALVPPDLAPLALPSRKLIRKPPLLPPRPILPLQRIPLPQRKEEVKRRRLQNPRKKARLLKLLRDRSSRRTEKVFLERKLKSVSFLLIALGRSYCTRKRKVQSIRPFPWTELRWRRERVARRANTG